MHTPDKPQLMVPVLEADRHAIAILSSYGGLLAASLTKKSKQKELLEHYLLLE